MFRLLKVTETRGGKKTVTEHAKPQPIQHHAPGSSIKRTRHIGSKLGPQCGPASNFGAGNPDKLTD
jgi:hypothetical protein